MLEQIPDGLLSNIAIPGNHFRSGLHRPAPSLLGAVPFCRMFGYGARVSLPPPFGFVPEPAAAPDDMYKEKELIKN